MKRSFFVLLILAACATDREKADEYYDKFSAIIIPYKEGTESTLTEMQRDYSGVFDPPIPVTISPTL